MTDPQLTGQPRPGADQPAARADAPDPFAFTPPSAARPVWTQEVIGPAASTTPSRWLEPNPLPLTPPAPAASGRSGAMTWAALVLVAFLAALLASGGTYLLVRGTATPTAAPVAAASNGTGGSQTTVNVTEESAITKAAAAVDKAVVTITSSQGNPADVLSGQSVTGVGSGILYDAAGWIITNRHVVCGATDLKVTLLDGRSFQGTVYGTDTLTDLAIVKISGTNLPTAPFGDSSNLQPGQLAVAIGSPLGDYTNSVTAGVVSGSGRDIQVSDDCSNGQTLTIHHLIQTDAAINPGNSGGALVDSDGQVIGINTAVAGQAQGIGFAIPVDLAKPIMQQAVAGQQLARPYLGVIYQQVTPALEQAQKLPIDYGAWLSTTGVETTTGPAPSGSTSAIVAGSPADQAGLKDGDIITAVDGQRVDAAHTLDDVLITHQPGTTVTISVLRNGQMLDLQLKLGTRPAGLQ
ncbi:MAG TPA: trypsin-like peptidase domain-containing protein [Candidatus Sulfotelmatobacter sp.]|nr:trypsin-like peptidase domain-containing protein [Candidatus Sulfotelmatobacter sp.]